MITSIWNMFNIAYMKYYTPRCRTIFIINSAVKRTAQLKYIRPNSYNNKKKSLLYYLHLLNPAVDVMLEQVRVYVKLIRKTTRRNIYLLIQVIIILTFQSCCFVQEPSFLDTDKLSLKNQ